MQRYFRYPALLLCCLLAACTTLSPPSSSSSKLAAPHTVLLISIDGLRPDAITAQRMPTLDALARDGVRAAWMNPSYPTLTFPNHYTLVTGLRPDHHGIVNNRMRDPALGSFVYKRASGRDGRWWDEAEPLWVTLQKGGGIAATMFWPGSEASIHGMRPDTWLPFDPSVTADARVDKVLSWLDRAPRLRPRLVTLYFEQVDHAAHQDGPFSVGARQAQQEVDAALARLLSGLQARGLRDAVDLVIVSDHGMAEVPPGHLLYLDDRVPADAIDVVSTGESVGLFPRPGHQAQVEAALLGRHQHDTCWRKSELPPRWHYGSNPRVPPIVCQADSGWEIDLHAEAQPRTHTGGEHGYPPEAPDMRAVFVANGPDFIAGTSLPAFDNVDVYPLLAHLLHVTPQANDGDLAPLLPALVEAAR